MELRGRLELIYKMIPQCGTLCDIGTDHAFIPAYALLNRRCERAIACDVRKGPLERAAETLAWHGLEGRMELRLGSGLEPISEDEADVIVIAGMGGALINELIGNRLDIVKHANRIILQPMYAQEAVRPFLWRNGFRVEDEELVREEDKIYQVMSVSFDRDNADQNSRSPLYEVVGEVLVKRKDPLLPDWLNNLIKRQKKIVNGLKRAAIPTPGLSREESLLAGLEQLLNQVNFRGPSPAD